MASNEVAAAFAMTVINTCSFTLNGPGFKLKLKRPRGMVKSGRIFSVSIPAGKANSCTTMTLIVKGLARNQKNYRDSIRVCKDRTVMRTDIHT